MEKRLYWSDIPRGRIFRLNPYTRVHQQIYEGRVVGGFTIQRDGSLLLFMDRCSIAIWRDGALDFVNDGLPGEADNRFNDVIADPTGRVFCGTMPTADRSATLYRLDTDGSITTVLDDVGLSNGMGFTPDRRHMYFTDSTARKIYLFDYALETGEISGQRVFVETPEGEGIPDGMTVDGQGYVWSARWDGSSLFRYAPDGSAAGQIRFPARKVSSVIFGGSDLMDMYVTTAGGDNRAENGPGAGGLFRLNLGIQGKPEYLSRLGLD
jgi:D-xylonolactonase